MSSSPAVADTLPADAPPALRAAHRALLGHPLLGRLARPAHWQVFMEHHVFAVWGFMSLLKRLQRDLTCVALPWRPPAHPRHSRCINALVLAEESDEDGRGGYCSHLQLYIEAMREAGADTGPIERLCAAVAEGKEAGAALLAGGAPAGVRPFVRHDLDVALHAPTVAVAASFFWGREAILADVFRGVLAQQGRAAAGLQRLRYYLARHIAVDGDEHGPMAADLLRTLVAAAPTARASADAAARAALAARAQLWDAILAALPPAGSAAADG